MHFTCFDDVDRPVIAYNSHKDVVKLCASLFADESVTKQSVCLIRPDRHHSIRWRVPLTTSKVVAQQADHPGSEVTWCELVVTVLVDGELGTNLLVHLDHRAGKSIDARLVVPDGVSRELLMQHRHQIRAIDDLQLIMWWISTTASQHTLQWQLHI